jgi:sortase A
MTAGARSRHLAGALRILEVILCVVGFAALVWLGFTRLATARDQGIWARELEAQIAARQRDPVHLTATPASVVRPARATASREVVGRLELRRLGVSAIAREGADAALLKRAVGHIPDTALPGEAGNAAFAGHRDTFFRSLEGVRSGDEIVVTTYTGRHRYRVRDTRVVSPRDVSVLDPTVEPTLTLITCFPFRYIGPAPDRFIVRADLVREEAAATAR